MWQPLPKLLSDVGHERMEQTKARVEHVDKRPPGLRRRLRVTAAHPLLGDLNVPVCILVPQKCVDSLASGAEVVGLELPGHGGDQPVAARDHPALGEGKAATRARFRRGAVGVHTQSDANTTSDHARRYRWRCRGGCVGELGAMRAYCGGAHDAISSSPIGPRTASAARSSADRSSRPITRKRAVFHSLLAKLRLPSTFSIASGTS